MESDMGDDEDSCGLLLRDIEEIGKALYVHNNPSKAFNSFPDHRGSVSSTTGILESKSKAVTKDPSRKDKKTSFWNWKPLKALAHIRHQRFNCCFFLQVHSIESLPSDFNNLNLCVAWKRKGDMLQTSPATISDGIAEIEETLMHRCTICASKTGSHSPAKYEPKLFLLQSSVIEAPMLDLGKHWIDLTRLLPLTLEELLGEERSLGKWTTSFKLMGKANGAMLNVSFGFSILDDNLFEPGYFVKVPNIVKVCKLMGGDNFSDFGARSQNNPLHNLDENFHTTSKQGPGIKNLDEIFANRLPVLASSITKLYHHLDEGNQMQSSSTVETNTGLVTGMPKETKSGDKSESMTTSGPKSYDARLPAGGISMMTPAVSLGQQYFKIGDFVTFGWNYTSLEATPTAVNIMATCSANKELYTIQMNQTVASNTGLVVWDTGRYQATAVQNPLLTQTYTLIIYDSDSSISATAQPGYLAVYNQYTFGMYSPQPYTPLGDFRCATCNDGLSSIEKNALLMACVMSMITIFSFTYFVRRMSVIW